MSNLAVIVVALFTSITAPLILSLLVNRQHRADKRMDYARQDAVAAKAEETAALLLASQKKAAELLVENNAAVAETAAAAQAQLTTIHTLVNSSLTASMEGQLEALKGQLATMVRLIPTPSPDEKAQMAQMIKMISDLQVTLQHRLEPPPGK